jgi:SAM-dependent methyltransferase
VRLALKSWLPGPAWRFLRRLYHLPGDVAGRLGHRRGSLVPPRRLARTVGPGDFEAVGREFLRHFVELGQLRPVEHVLDVGCGAGRIAVPLSGYLTPPGRYEGFDVDAAAVAWCADRLTTRFPHFRVRRVDVSNRVYNAGGAVPAADFLFPYDDAAFDFVIGTSVFTHLLPDALARYLAEAARVLRPGGRLFATFFLLNAESRRLVAAGKSRMDFRHELEGCATTDAAAPEAAVAYDERRLVELAAGSGLEVRRPIWYGAWCGRDAFRSFQDILVVSRPGPGGPGSRSPRREAAAPELGGEIEAPGPDRRAVRHGPEQLELELVRILGVQRQADAVIRLAEQGAGVDQPPARAGEIGQLADLPGGVIHPRRPLVRSPDAGLLEQAEVVVVGTAGDLEEGRVRVPHRDLEAQEVAVEAHAPLHVRHPQDQVLEPLEADPGPGRGHPSSLPRVS